jgi:hypothetical protein
MPTPLPNYILVSAGNISDLQTQMNAQILIGYVPYGELLVIPTNTVAILTPANQANQQKTTTTVNQFNFYQSLILKICYNYDYFYKPFGAELY